MDYDIISMEHLLLALVALVSFVRSHLRLYHPPPVHHSYKAIFCTWKSLLFWGSNILYPVTVNTECHSILSILVSRTSNSTKTWSVYPGLASTFLELKRQHPDEIRNLCPRNLHDSKRFRRILFYTLAFYRLFRLPYRRGRKFKNVEADRWEMQR